LGVVAAIEEATTENSVMVVALTGGADPLCSRLDLRENPQLELALSSARNIQLDDIVWFSRFVAVPGQRS